MADQTPLHDVIVIGSGPAGYTAAIYTARAELKPLVFEGTSFGGALMTTTEVENYPGFRAGIQGPELMDEMREQALRFGADLQMEDVESVSLDGPVKEVVTAGGETHRTRAVILAMGAAARYLGVPGEQELLGRGVSACATCDGFFFKNQDIAVIGGGVSILRAIFDLLQVDDMLSALPQGMQIVCVELAEGAMSLPEFQHPQHALYVFGPEDGSIPQAIIHAADSVVYIPTIGCMNLAATVNVVLYDRLAKSAANHDDDARIRSSRDVNNRLKTTPREAID